MQLHKDLDLPQLDSDISEETESESLGSLESYLCIVDEDAAADAPCYSLDVDDVISSDDEDAPMWYRCLCKEDRVSLARFLAEIDGAEDAVLKEEALCSLQTTWSLKKQKTKKQKTKNTWSLDREQVDHLSKYLMAFECDGDDLAMHVPPEDAGAIQWADSDGDGGLMELNTQYPEPQGSWNVDASVDNAVQSLGDSLLPKRRPPEKEKQKAKKHVLHVLRKGKGGRKGGKDKKGTGGRKGKHVLDKGKENAGKASNGEGEISSSEDVEEEMEETSNEEIPEIAEEENPFTAEHNKWLKSKIKIIK